MLTFSAGVRVHLALGVTDMRKGFDGLAAQVQTVLQADPFSGHLFLFRKRQPVATVFFSGLKFQGRSSLRRSMVWPRQRRSMTAAM